MDSNIVLSYYEERTRDWRTRYVADVNFPFLGQPSIRQQI